MVWVRMVHSGKGTETRGSGSLKPGSLDFLWLLRRCYEIDFNISLVRTTLCEGHYILSTLSELSRNHQKLIMSFVHLSCGK